MLSFLNETFTFWHSHGQEAKWMLMRGMRLGTDALCSTKPMGWVLASELVLRNQQPALSSLSAFLATMSLEGHAHGLRGLGVTDVESLALQTETSAKAGLPAPARRILRRALLARSRKLEVADDARRREQTAQQAKDAAIPATLGGDRVRPQTTADFRDHAHDGAVGTPLRFSSAASLGIGKDWQRPSARARSKRRQQRDGSFPWRVPPWRHPATQRVWTVRCATAVWRLSTGKGSSGGGGAAAISAAALRLA